MKSEQQYILAFNNGYVLAQHEPKILNTITKSLVPSNNYLEGLFAGKKQLEMENAKNQLFELGQLRCSIQNKENNLGREI